MNETEFPRGLYREFSAATSTPSSLPCTKLGTWANGVEGGHVHGRTAVREYSTRQWSTIAPMWNRLLLP